MSKSDRYQYTECGLDNIYLLNGFENVETPRGLGVQIKDIEGLHRAIGDMLVQDRKNLAGKEFRFLRHEMNLTQQNLAGIIGVNAQTIARMEKRRGGEEADGPIQRLLRLLYIEHINGNRLIIEPLKRLADLDEILHEGEDEIDFEETDEGWQTAMVA